MIIPLLVLNVFAYTHASLLITPKDCTASSEHSSNNSCDKAFDGITDSANDGVWVTDGEGQGSWIQLNFDGNYLVTHLRLQQRYETLEMSKGIQLDFSDGSKQDIELAYRNYSAFIWEDFPLTPVTSMYIKLTVLSVWTTNNNGFIELEVYRPDDCRVTEMGNEYLGMVDQTSSGIPCQYWTSDIPHIRDDNPRDAANFPDATLEGASNFCRNPLHTYGGNAEFLKYKWWDIGLILHINLAMTNMIHKDNS